MDFTLLYVIAQILDILIVAYVLYRALLWIRDTRALRLLKGLLVLVVCFILSNWLHLTTIHWALSQSWTVILVAVAVIFQPELRSGLERLGTGRSWRGTSGSYSHYQETIHELKGTVADMARSRTGLLLVLEGKNGLQAQINTGIPLDARISRELLDNLFFDRAPLHDGAVIIRGSRVAAASCLLPLTANEELDSHLGTRHRAALGLSEIADALVIVVSEETGSVSLAKGGKLQERIDEKALDAALRAFYGLEAMKTRRGHQEKSGLAGINKILIALRENLIYKVIALILALFFWCIVNDPFDKVDGLPSAAETLSLNREL